MPKKAVSKRKARPKPSTEKFLNKVPNENAFHFYVAIGNDTGIAATDLNEFATKMEIVPVESVDFHFQRKDFQKWVAETVGDEELSECINIFGATHFAEDLRKEMVRILQERITELTGFTVKNEDAIIKPTAPLQS